MALPIALVAPVTKTRRFRLACHPLYQTTIRA